MNLNEADLNLLAVLEVLVDRRSVSGAAQRLGLSQSATSHALQRLRRLLNDEVLVRAGGAMQPTPIALRFMEAVRPALTQIAAALNEKDRFNPETSNRSFVLRISEYVGSTVLAPLCTMLRRKAPGVRLSVLPMAAPDERSIEPGEVHVRAERSRRTSARPMVQALFEDDFTVIMSACNPNAGQPMTLDQYLTLPHLKITADAVGTNMVDEALQSRGLSRNVVASVPSWFAMRRAVLDTDLIAVVPRHWTADKTFIEGLACSDLPLEGISLSVEMIWHGRDDQDPGITWLRKSITTLLGELFPASATAL